MWAMPVWAVVLVYWLHLIGALLWLGSLAATAFLVLPAALKTLEDSHQFVFLDDFQRRLDAIATFCLFLLLATGMFQMSASRFFSGFLSTANVWSSAILVKHILFIFMVIINSVLTWGIFPAYRRALIRYRRGGEAGAVVQLMRRQMLAVYLLLGLSALILAATAVAHSV